jgi:hypothetical protein
MFLSDFQYYRTENVPICCTESLKILKIKNRELFCITKSAHQITENQWFFVAKQDFSSFTGWVCVQLCEPAKVLKCVEQKKQSRIKTL